MHNPTPPLITSPLSNTNPKQTRVLLVLLLLVVSMLMLPVHAADLDANDPARTRDYTLGGAELEISGIYALLRPAGEQYQIVQWANERDELLFQPGDEILSLGLDMRHYYVPYLYKRDLDASGSWMFGRADVCPEDRYHPCRSAFTKSDKAGNLVMGLLTAGMTTMAGSMRKLDDKKIRATAEQVDFVPLARHKLIDRAVESARTDNSIIGYDQALQIAEPYVTDEGRQAIIDERAAKVERREQAKKANKERVKAEEIKTREAEVRFRSTMKAGDETNCGLVIEVKGEIVQIQTSRSTKWVRKEELSPQHLRQTCYVSP